MIKQAHGVIPFGLGYRVVWVGCEKPSVTDGSMRSTSRFCLPVSRSEERLGWIGAQAGPIVNLNQHVWGFSAPKGTFILSHAAARWYSLISLANTRRRGRR